MIWTEFSAAQLHGFRRFEKHAELVRTRGVEGCRARDFDDPKTGAMVGGHGYCTQEGGQESREGERLSAAVKSKKKFFEFLSSAPRSW